MLTLLCRRMLAQGNGSRCTCSRYLTNHTSKLAACVLKSMHVRTHAKTPYKQQSRPVHCWLSHLTNTLTRT
jgi:hypothetical protein